MKLHMKSIASTLFLVGCSDAEGGGGPSAVTPSPTPTATASPSPTPTPTPTASPSPGPTPTPSPASYLAFTDLYTSRLGRDLLLTSACSGVAFSAQPPALLTTFRYGTGLSFRYVLTPQVWALSGDGWGLSFDGRNADPAAVGTEVAYFQTNGTETERFSIARPSVGGAGLDYARLASIAKLVTGVSRSYHCVTGVPTLDSDLPAGAIAYPRTVVLATAHVRGGAALRPYGLTRSAFTVAADLTARSVTISLALTGTPSDAAGGPDIALGTLSATAPIDASGNFVGTLASADGSVTGSVSGRFFGPQAIEIGASFGVTAATAAGARPAFSATGGLYGVR